MLVGLELSDVAGDSRVGWTSGSGCALAFPPTFFALFLFPGMLSLWKLWNEWQNRHLHTHFIFLNYKRRLYATATSQVRMKRRANEAAVHYTPRLRHTYAALRAAIRPKKPVISQVRHRIAIDTPRERHAYAIYVAGLLICIKYASCLGVWPRKRNFVKYAAYVAGNVIAWQ